MGISILASFVVGMTYWSRQHPLVTKSLFIVGIVLAGVGAAGRAWSMAYISGHKLKTLVRTGPYSLCRNPLYFFSMLLGAGLGFCTKTLTVPIAIVTMLTALYVLQIRKEEQVLRQVFGSEYQHYLKSTPRFFPSYGSFWQPEEVVVSPRLLTREMISISGFLMLIAFLQLLEAGHEVNLLPTLFYIY
jgi:protein-S-isoprenylcysteine O-methyltransferase Ste14